MITTINNDNQPQLIANDISTQHVSMLLLLIVTQLMDILIWMIALRMIEQAYT